jgi:hypothetical protein
VPRVTSDRRKSIIIFLTLSCRDSSRCVSSSVVLSAVIHVSYIIMWHRIFIIARTETSHLYTSSKFYSADDTLL